jgi:hypothetical protein
MWLRLSRSPGCRVDRRTRAGRVHDGSTKGRQHLLASIESLSLYVPTDGLRHQIPVQTCLEQANSDLSRTSPAVKDSPHPLQALIWPHSCSRHLGPRRRQEFRNRIGKWHANLRSQHPPPA